MNIYLFTSFLPLAFFFFKSQRNLANSKSHDAPHDITDPRTLGIAHSSSIGHADFDANDVLSHKVH